MNTATLTDTNCVYMPKCLRLPVEVFQAVLARIAAPNLRGGGGAVNRGERRLLPYSYMIYTICKV